MTCVIDTIIGSQDLRLVQCTSIGGHYLTHGGTLHHNYFRQDNTDVKDQYQTSARCYTSNLASYVNVNYIILLSNNLTLMKLLLREQFDAIKATYSSKLEHKLIAHTIGDCVVLISLPLCLNGIVTLPRPVPYYTNVLDRAFLAYLSLRHLLTDVTRLILDWYLELYLNGTQQEAINQLIQRDIVVTTIDSKTETKCKVIVAYHASCPEAKRLK